MGASRYSSYSGKGSTTTSTSRSTSSTRKNVRETKSKSSMLEMLKLLEEVERCREVVTKKQNDLDSAKEDLEKAEQKVTAQIDKLDPETKNRLRKMMGVLEEKDEERE